MDFDLGGFRSGGFWLGLILIGWILTRVDFEPGWFWSGGFWLGLISIGWILNWVDFDRVDFERGWILIAGGFWTCPKNLYFYFYLSFRIGSKNSVLVLTSFEHWTKKLFTFQVKLLVKLWLFKNLSLNEHLYLIFI